MYETAVKDVLSAEVIREYLSGSELADDLQLDVFDTIGSTNNVCKERAAEGMKNFYVAVAAHQSRGRGRKGRSFLSPDSTGLYISFLLRPVKLKVQDSLRLTTMAAVATAEAIEAATGKEPGIKWVNDLYLNARKVCGILTEGAFALQSQTGTNHDEVYLDYAVVGIGINVYEPEGGFAEEIKDIAGAVADERKENLRSKIAAELIKRLKFYYEDAVCDRSSFNTVGGDKTESKPKYVEEYKNRCIVPGLEIEVIKPGQSVRPATAICLDDELRLLVKYANGEEEWLMSGEISTKL